MSTRIKGRVYLSIPEAAEQIGCTRQTMHRYVTNPKYRSLVEATAGKIEGFKDALSGDIFIASTWVTRFKRRRLRKIK